MLRRFALLAAIFPMTFISSNALAQTPTPVEPGGTPAPIIADHLQEGDRVALCGDSITEQRNYTAIVEGYLLACKPAQKLDVAQFGWGGETAWGFKTRIKNDVLWFNPTVATISYGMNDGGYGPVDPKRLADYRESTIDIITQLKEGGVRQIVLVGPGVVDASDAFAWGKTKGAGVYNRTLATFNKAAGDLAKEQGVSFADMHTTMYGAMQKLKAKFPNQSIAGNDGIHPDNVGHMVMAYAILKALGCDGNIGTITVDLSGNSAEATDGHKVLGVQNGKVDIESSRYPYPVLHDKGPTSLGMALELVPFNQDLNRFMLVVKNATAQQYKVTWGKETKTFEAAELAKGINLADVFNSSPFSDAFGRIDSAVHAQQDFETPLMKQIIHNLDEWVKLAPESEKTWRDTADGAKKLDELLRKRTAATVVPVKHSITIVAM